MENDSGTVSPYAHSLDELDTGSKFIVKLSSVLHFLKLPPHFLAELINFLELLHASLSTDPSPSGEKRKQMRKHDIRRYFSTMFNNIVNSMDFDLILSYFETFMNSDAPLEILYNSAPHELDLYPPPVHHVRVEGPHTTAYYLMCLGVFFPDMVSQLKNGQVITVENQLGCKLVLETTLKCTRLFDIPIELCLQQMAMFYEHYRTSAAMFPHFSKSHSRSTDSENNTPTYRRRAERKIPKKRHYDHDDCLQLNVHSFVSSAQLCTPPRVMRIHCVYVILLDERNHITSISVTATEML